MIIFNNQNKNMKIANDLILAQNSQIKRIIEDNVPWYHKNLMKLTKKKHYVAKILGYHIAIAPLELEQGQLINEEITLMKRKKSVAKVIFKADKIGNYQACKLKLNA